MTDTDSFLNFLFGPMIAGSEVRPRQVLDWAKAIDDTKGSDFWTVILQAWSSFDRIPHEEFAFQFARFSGHAPGAPHLPDRMTLYRGQDDGASVGLSWSLDPEVAKDFARGHRGCNISNPLVLELEVTRDQVAFFTNDRDEQEVVLLEIPLLEICAQ